MKKIIALLLVSLMAICLLCACGSGKDGASNTSKTAEYKMGDTVSTDSVEFTLDDLTYSEYWDPNGDFVCKFMGDGNVCANVYFKVKNLGKEAIYSHTAAMLVLDYDNGYTYKTGDVYHKSSNGDYVANYEELVPLSDAEELVGYFEIPITIQDDTEHSLHINVTIYNSEGEEETFVYVIR